MVVKTFIALGANLGDRYSYLARARELLFALPESRIINNSGIYETEPVEYPDQPWFLNQVVELETSLPPEKLLAELLKIEQKLGRTRILPKGPRAIDLDILFYGVQTITTPELTIPHPYLQMRRFVLVPLNEIASTLVHPVLAKPVRQLLSELGDTHIVRNYSIQPASRPRG